ncbi:MAG: tyrosine-type recombinase/integrase [Spirochaetia bacterium]
MDAEGLEKLAKAVVVETLKDDLKARAKLEKIEWQTERETFLARVRSVHTRRAYSMALDRLEGWAARQGITLMDITPALADDWIESEKSEGSPATVRLRVSGGASAFFTWMERRHAEGTLRAAYSAHDLRHAFAVRLYQASHDVYQVEQALGHANVAVTEAYLRSIGVKD